MKPIKCHSLYEQPLWANNQLSKIRQRDSYDGASWDICVHPDFPCTIQGGDFDGKPLLDVLKEYPKETLGDTPLSKILKLGILDAKEMLSIQVHPDPIYAKAHNQESKTESWYIQEAKEDAYLVVGCDLDSKEEIKKAIDTQSIENHLCKIPVKKGDYITLPYGTLHALGAGIMAIEISTNSNTTYRFYDFNRKDVSGKARELHLEDSLAVVVPESKPEVISIPLDGIEKEIIIPDAGVYETHIIDFHTSYSLVNDESCFTYLTNTDYPIQLQYENEVIELKPLESIFIPASCKNIELLGNSRILLFKPR